MGSKQDMGLSGVFFIWDVVNCLSRKQKFIRQGFGNNSKLIWEFGKILMFLSKKLKNIFSLKF